MSCWLIRAVHFLQDDYRSGFTDIISKCNSKYRARMKQVSSWGTETAHHLIKTRWISNLLCNPLLSQRAVLWEPSTNDLAADQPLRPIRLPERRPVPGGCRGARLPLHARFLRQQMWQDGHRSLPGSGWIRGAAEREAPSHGAYFIAGNVTTFDLC